MTDSRRFVRVVSGKNSKLTRIAERALSNSYKVTEELSAGALRQSVPISTALVIWDASTRERSTDHMEDSLSQLALADQVPLLLILKEPDTAALHDWSHGHAVDFIMGMPRAKELKARVQLLVARADSLRTVAPAANAAINDGDGQADADSEAFGAHQQALKALKESEAKFRTIANAMPQMVWSTRPDGHHDYYNQQWYDFTGVPEGSTDGDKWNGMFHQGDQAKAWKAWRHSLSTGEPYEIEYRVRHRSGEYRWTLGRALPVKDDSGKIIRWMGTCTDIHDHKLTENALKNASRQKDQFLAVLAHELRNPLAPLRNSAALLRQAAETADSPNSLALDVIERQVEHMTRLVGDLMDVARVTTGRLQLQRVPCELNDVICQAVQDFRYLLDKAGIAHSVEFSEQPLWIRGDCTRIAQVVGNLLHNAAKFTSPGGTVKIRIQALADEKAIVSVEDSGEGIEPALVKTLFNPFVQAEQGLARVHGGLGLGLSLVKGFMELHEGSVAVSSEGKDRGAVFTLTFPRIDTPKQIDEPRMAITYTLAQTLKIVLIDDNKDMIDTMSVLLEMEGHRVATALDGSTGIGVIEHEKPDVVICDIGLPGTIDGYSVARAVCERAPAGDKKPLLLALSGYGDKEARQRSKDSGFDFHLVKPLEVRELNKLLYAQLSQGLPLTALPSSTQR